MGHDCSPHHPRFGINWPATNRTHVIKTYMYKIRLKAACYIAETVQVPTRPHFGSSVTTVGHQMLRQTLLPSPASLTLPSELLTTKMQLFILYKLCIFALRNRYFRHEGKEASLDTLITYLLPNSLLGNG